MSSSNWKLNWNADIFEECYTSIKFENEVNLELLPNLKNDFLKILLVPPKNETSRKLLDDESKTHVLSSGDEVKFNREFIEIAAFVSSDFQLDELEAADIVYQSQCLSFQKGLKLRESARLLFLQRYQYILNCLGFIISTKKLHLLLDNQSDYNTFFDTIIQSFDKIYEILSITNDLIDKQKVTDNINSISFIDSITFTKSELFQIHELLSQILYSLIDNYIEKYQPLKIYTKLIDHINKSLSDEDILILHYFPSLFKITTSPSDDSSVGELYSHMTLKINNDYKQVSSEDELIDTTKSTIRGYELVVYLFFLTKFIGWCKIQPSRTSKYDFKTDILLYIEKLINYGVMERILSYTSESTTMITRDSLEWRNLYDFRSLLQRVCPRLHPVKFEYPSAQELINTASSRPGFENVCRLGDTSSLTISSNFNELLLIPFFHHFFTDFISNAAIVLTSLRDSEEDFLLSSINKKQIEFDKDEKKMEANNQSPDTLDLDEIATRSELERFYLAFTYTYNNRPELCASFWSDECFSDTTGLISWGLSNNSSPLITATFCLLLGSLSCGGSDAATKMWDFLISNHNATLKKNDFSIISIDSIIDSLIYYIDSLNEYYEHDVNEQLKAKQKRQELLFSKHSAKQDEDSARLQIIIQLSEDSILFISGFVQLISSIVRNLRSSDERPKHIKKIAFDRFNGLIKKYLNFDNKIKGTKLRKKISDVPEVSVSDENNTILLNLFFGLMGDFVLEDDDLELRYKIWRILDRWAYHSLNDETENSSTNKNLQSHSKDKINSHYNIGVTQGFELNLVHFTEVVNFSLLLQNLLAPLKNKNDAFAKYALLYPADLGLGYRNGIGLGIWPYMEFLFTNVFANTNKINSVSDRQLLQSILMNIMHNSLSEVDWKFLTNIAPKAVKDLHNIDNLFDSLIPGIELNFQTFTKLHHSIALMNYLFHEKVYNTFFSIIDMGLEYLSCEQLEDLLHKSLLVFDLVLKLQETYINWMLPILKNHESNNTKEQHGFNTSMSLALKNVPSIFDNTYIPRDVGTFGIYSFYELLLFNLSTVVYFTLYVGSPNAQIANSAISILSKINKSNSFVAKNDYKSSDPLLKKNRLLTTLISIDESTKLKYAFMDQFESQSDNLSIKYKILQFLLDDLNRSNGSIPTTAHFLLGFVIRGGQIALGDQLQNSLLKSLLEVLDVSLKLLCEIDFSNNNAQSIDLAPAKLSSLILEIIVTLSRNSISANATLNYLRSHDNLFEKLIALQPKIDSETIWYLQKFNGDLNDGVNNLFIQNELSFETLVSFIKYRNLVLQYLSLEFHHIELKSKKEYYNLLLLDNKVFLDGSPRILGFLDILNYTFKNFELRKMETYEQRYNVPLIMEQITESDDIDLSVLNDIYKVISQSSNLITADAKIAFSENIIIEANNFRDFVVKFTMSASLRKVQLKCLHSWCQLIEVSITNNTTNSEDFILEVLQVILPKINDYLESDITFSEELISLSVLLFDMYAKEFLQDNTGEFVIGMQRLFPLIKTCISGILNSNSTPNLRSDLYVLANKFLTKVLISDRLVNETINILKSIDKKFIGIIGNDAIYSEGSSRITSILLLETLIHLTSLSKVDFFLDLLIQNNSLLLLVMSIKRTDELLQISSKNQSGVTLDTLLYELTAFKSTLYLLIRIAQTKVGALTLIQNELFSILKESKILKIDPDLGLDLRIEDAQKLKEVQISLVLDTPITIEDVLTDNKDGKNISYLEFLIPIFQLISTILLSMGPSYKPSLFQAKDLFQTFNTLIVGIMKRDILLEKNDIKIEDEDTSGIKELVKLFTLLDSLIHYNEKESN